MICTFALQLCEHCAARNCIGASTLFVRLQPSIRVVLRKLGNTHALLICLVEFLLALSLSFGVLPTPHKICRFQLIAPGH